MPKKTHTPTALFRLRVSITGSDPEIWRQLEVAAELTLAELHDVLQIAFGWQESHLHAFTDENPFAPRRRLPRIGREPRVWGSDDPLGDPEEDQLSEREWTLAPVFDGFDGPLYYEYDFGDGWVHLIELVERIDDDPAAPKALLLRGERRGPLEDSGGIGGYYEKLEAIADPQHPEYEEIIEWVRWVAGPWTPFDPDALDVDHVNRELAARFNFGLGMSGLPTDASPGDQKAAGGKSDAGTPPLVSADSAIIDLLERLPVPLRGELRGLLRRSDALEPVDVELDTAAAMVEPFLWLVRRAGTDGILLTQAGWMPPAVVSDAMRELGWGDRWIGAGNREEQTRPIANLREDAVQFGLLRKRNGVLHATVAGRKFVDDPVGLWRMLAASFLRRTRSGAERDIATLVALDIASGHTAVEIGGIGHDMSGVLFGLEALGWASADDSSLTRDVILRPAYRVLNQLEGLGAFEGSRRMRYLPTDGGRAFARAMLLAPME